MTVTRNNPWDRVDDCAKLAAHGADLGVAGGSLPELRSFTRRGVHLTRYEPDEQEATRPAGRRYHEAGRAQN
jgi:hypothetical protein